MATDQSEIVRELVRRRESLDPEKQAVVSELAKRFNIQDPRSSVKITSGEATIGATPASAVPSEVTTGVLKGAGSTLLGLSRIGHNIARKIPGLTWATDRVLPITDEQFQAIDPIIQNKLKPEGTAQNVGFGAEQIGEYFAPGSAITKSVKALNAGAKFAKAVPVLAKMAPMVEYGARGAMEAIPAGVIAKAQGQDVGQTAAFAMAAPSFGKLLNKTGATKAATGVAKGVTGMVSKTLAEKIPEVQQSPRQMMWRALKPNVRNRDFDQALDRAMPEIYAQSKMTLRKIENVDDFLEVLKATKKRVWEPYAKMIGESVDKVDGNKIADAIESSISDYHKTFSPKLTKQVKATASIYRKRGDISLSEAEDWLEVVNAKIKNYYEQYPQARTAIQKASPKMKGLITEAQELRAQINEAVDNMGGVVTAVTKDGYSGKMFKQVYGGLQSLEGEAIKRSNVSKRLAPESLTAQMANVHAAGEFIWGALRGHPLDAAAALGRGLAYRKAGKLMQLRNSTDYLIEKAFKDFGDYVEQSNRSHRIIPAVSSQIRQE